MGSAILDIPERLRPLWVSQPDVVESVQVNPGGKFAAVRSVGIDGTLAYRHCAVRPRVNLDTCPARVFPVAGVPLLRGGQPPVNPKENHDARQHQNRSTRAQVRQDQLLTSGRQGVDVK